MIKILHTGDIHLGDLAGPTKDGANLRRQDTLRCMDAIVNKARTEGPTVTIIAGDLFNRSRVWADTALDDVIDKGGGVAVLRLLVGAGAEEAQPRLVEAGDGHDLDRPLRCHQVLHPRLGINV